MKNPKESPVQERAEIRNPSMNPSKNPSGKEVVRVRLRTRKDDNEILARVFPKELRDSYNRKSQNPEFRVSITQDQVYWTDKDFDRFYANSGFDYVTLVNISNTLKQHLDAIERYTKRKD